ncbi:MAG: RNA polymerase sigma factor [Oscillospiraceae bacterium]|nr:RNA polymerase sigma factor [Oscillospiraceae bacterium]
MLALYLGLLENNDDKIYLTQLYVSYERVMYAAAFGILGSSAAAEDAVHDSFIKVIHHMSLCRQIADNKIGAWLVMIVKNTSFDMLRKTKRIVDFDSVNDLPVADDDIATWVESVDIKELLRQLPTIYYTTLSLKFLEGWTDKEIAEVLGISESTVRSRIYQARKMLKKRMEGYYDRG